MLRAKSPGFGKEHGYNYGKNKRRLHPAGGSRIRGAYAENGGKMGSRRDSRQRRNRIVGGNCAGRIRNLFHYLYYQGAQRMGEKPSGELTAVLFNDRAGDGKRRGSVRSSDGRIF